MTVIQSVIDSTRKVYIIHNFVAYLLHTVLKIVSLIVQHPSCLCPFDGGRKDFVTFDLHLKVPYYHPLR